MVVFMVRLRETLAMGTYTIISLETEGVGFGYPSPYGATALSVA
jgi:hypothetical protein